MWRRASKGDPLGFPSSHSHTALWKQYSRREHSPAVRNNDGEYGEDESELAVFRSSGSASWLWVRAAG